MQQWGVIICCLEIIRVCQWWWCGGCWAAGRAHQCQGTWEDCFYGAGCSMKALIFWAWFCCPGAVRAAHEHPVVLWYPVVPEEPCCAVCSLLRRAHQCLLHHGRQHRRLEAEASWPGVENCSAKNGDRKRGGNKIWDRKSGGKQNMGSLQWLSAALLAGVPLQRK